MAQVKTYREETRCAHCGRFIRNVVEIDGVQYGIRCAEAFLPRFTSVQQVGKKAAVVTVNHHAMWAEAQTLLGADRFNRFASQPAAYLAEYLEKARARQSDTVPAVELILAVKSA